MFCTSAWVGVLNSFSPQSHIDWVDGLVPSRKLAVKHSKDQTIGLPSVTEFQYFGLRNMKLMKFGYWSRFSWLTALPSLLPLLWRTVNSLAFGKCGNNFKIVISNSILQIDILSISCEIALRRMPQNPFDDKSTLVKVMAWCCQATSHYLNQLWPRFMSPYGITRPQWVNKSVSHFICD